jgi:hypothetical protein
MPRSKVEIAILMAFDLYRPYEQSCAPIRQHNNAKRAMVPNPDRELAIRDARILAEKPPWI